MKIIALSDIHGRIENLKKLLEKTEKKADLIVVCGDWTNYGSKETALEEIKELNFAKVFAIPGNLDSKEVFELLSRQKISLHSKKEKFEGISFIGFGGGIENGIGEILFSEKEVFESVEKLAKNEKDFALLTHVPPKNSKLDFSNSGEHIGSESVREIIEKFQPKLHICGHCHEAFGIEKIKKTLCVNVAAVKEGKLAIIEIEKDSIEIKVDFVKI